MDPDPGATAPGRPGGSTIDSQSHTAASAENLARAAHTWDTIDTDQVRSVAWVSLRQVADDLNESFAPGEGPILLTHRLLADNRVVTSGLTGGALVCGDMQSEQGFFDQPWSTVDFADVHGYDLSEVSLDRFATTAFRWHPHVTDCNQLQLTPGMFDLLVASHGAHHVADLDCLFTQARAGLKPGGLMYIYEWIGPTYLQIPRRNAVVATALLLALFPRRATRTTHMGKVKGLRYLQDPPESFDPSEACNSTVLYDRFTDNFEVLAEYRHGALTYPMFEGIAPNLATEQPRTRRRIAMVLAIEKFLTRHGIISPLFTMAVGRRRPMASDPVAEPLAEPDVGPAGQSDAPTMDTVRALTERNRAEPSVDVERRLVDVRHRAFLATGHPDPAVAWPPPAPDLFAGVTGLPEIDVSDLSVDTLRAGILGRGSLVVRNVFGPDQVARLHHAVTSALDAYDAHVAGTADPATDAWYHPFTPAPGAGTVTDDDRYWVREGGGVLAADSPRALFELLELLDQTPIAAVMADHLGETPALSVKKTTLRRVDPVAVTGWHQDGAFLGADVRSVNVWIALSHCGVDAPSLDIVAHRLDHLVTPGVDGAIFEWSVGDKPAEDAAGPGGIVRAVFAPGDVIVFDQMNLHRTSPDLTMTNSRVAIEAWFFAPSHYPTEQIPIAT